jgi:hypothetical protein
MSDLWRKVYIPGTRNTPEMGTGGERPINIADFKQLKEDLALLFRKSEQRNLLSGIVTNAVFLVVGAAGAILLELYKNGRLPF